MSITRLPTSAAFFRARRLGWQGLVVADKPAAASVEQTAPSAPSKPAEEPTR
jgi:hypothetical protein